MEPFPLPAPAFSGDSRGVPFASAFDWLRAGWASFVAAPGVWIVIALLMMIIGALVSIVPFIGWFASLVMTPLLIAGALVACRRIAAGETPQVGDLFWGFREKTGPLAIVGVLYMAGWLLLILLAMLVVGGGILGGMILGHLAGVGTAFSGAFLAAMVIIAGGVPLIMAVCFAPALVAFHDMAPAAAMQASFTACLKNLGAILVLAVVLVIAGLLATLPLGLGWLVLLPIMFGTLYACYRDVFPTS